jgi:hypothetical protein
MIVKRSFSEATFYFFICVALFVLFVVMSFLLSEAKAKYLVVLASKYGYNFESLNYQTSYVSFTKGEIKVIVYVLKKGYTVASCLNHSKKGKNQFIRKNLNYGGLVSVLENPRVHTKKEYFLTQKHKKTV